MKKIIIILIVLLLVQNIFAFDENKIRDFISKEYNINNISIAKVNQKFNGNDLYIAFHKILNPTQNYYYGMFDRAVLFYEINDLMFPLIHFNGPVIINQNGNRVFDFSGERYKYLNFFGWEVEFTNSKNGLTVVLNCRLDLGENVADSIGMYFNNEYNQFVARLSPFNYNFSLNCSDPLIIGLARYGYVGSNEFENTIDSELKKLSKEELRLCRNAIYAVHGYRFSDESLMRYFYQFNWYKPGTKEDNEKIVLSPKQEELKKVLIDLEKK